MAAAAPPAGERSRITAGHLGPYLQTVELPDHFWMAKKYHTEKATANKITLT